MIETHNYTKNTGPIVRGGRWPPGGDGSIKVILTRTENGVALDWPVGADAWTWEMLISRNQYGGIPDLTLTAFTVTRSANVMTLCFFASSAETNTLPGNDRRRDFVHIKSSNGAIYGYYGYGRAAVESHVAEV